MTGNTQKQDVHPLSAENLSALNQFVSGYNRDQLLWSSAYLAGLAAYQGPIQASVLESSSIDEVQDLWTILYASETGNSKGIAEELAMHSREAGLSVEINSLRDYRPRRLSRLDNVLFVVATHGIGEAPEGSEAFFEYWFSEKAPRLENLNYSILALGDSSYIDYCEMGKLLDQRLNALGATAIAERVDCDLDFDSPAQAWTNTVVQHASQSLHSEKLSSVTPIRSNLVPGEYSRKNPYVASVLVDQRITSRDSDKDTRHLELYLEGSGLSYQPGDSLGVVPENPPELVGKLLDMLGMSGNESIMFKNEAMSLSDALTRKKEITVLSKPFLDVLANDSKKLHALINNREELTKLFNTRQLIDIASEYKNGWTAQGFVDALRSLTPRLYSIASSPDANPDEAHLTVDVVRYNLLGRDHWGSASNYLASGVSQVPVYIESNDNFRLPKKQDTPAIMIGAGTGIAPYRAFVEHRREHGHTGDNWLIFGNRNFSDDFLYQTEWLQYLKEGSLKHLDLAFSRDQEEKVYVQHRIAEQEQRLYAWLDRGAHIYVCGDATSMAEDVNTALLGVLQSKGGLSPERAAEYLATLKSESRYQRDVY